MAGYLSGYRIAVFKPSDRLFCVISSSADLMVVPPGLDTRDSADCIGMHKYSSESQCLLLCYI
jgi:hypothetical protein